MTMQTFRNKLGELVDIQTVPATRLKNDFANLLDQAARGGVVAITRHAATRAVLISFEEFESLAGERSSSLDVLGAKFDGLLERMQTPAARKGMQAGFDAAPQALGRAAVKSARK